MFCTAPLSRSRRVRPPTPQPTLDQGTYLKPQGRGQRRPRDLRLRAVDPDHFTRPPPAHGELHHQRPGISPPEGHASVIAQEGDEDEAAEEASLFSPPLASSSSSTFLSLPRGAGASTAAAAGGGGGGGCGNAATPPFEHSRAGARAAGGSAATRAAAAAAAAGAEAAAAGAAAAAVGTREGGVVPDIREMYHLDAASLAGFGEAAAAATRALEALLASVGGRGGHRDSSGGGGGGHRRGEAWSAEGLPPPTGVASLLLGADGDGGGGGSGEGAGGIVEGIAEVRDSFRELVVAAASLGVVVPCAPEGAGEGEDRGAARCEVAMRRGKPQQQRRRRVLRGTYLAFSFLPCLACENNQLPVRLSPTQPPTESDAATAV